MFDVKKSKPGSTPKQAASFPTKPSVQTTRTSASGESKLQPIPLKVIPRPAPASPQTSEPGWKKVPLTQPVQRRLIESQGFKQLNNEDKKVLLTYVGGQDPYVSAPARQDLESKISQKQLDLNDPKALRQIIVDQPSRQYVLDPLPGTFDKSRKAASISKPVYAPAHQYDGEKANSRKYTISVGQQQIDVFLPINLDAKKGKFHSVEEVAKALGALPPASLKLIQSVDVEPSRNPEDKHWAKEYKDPNFRSYMTAGNDRIVNIYPSLEKQSQTFMDGSMIHETGHILSTTTFTEKDWKSWVSAQQKDNISPSTYSTTDRAEDFSESLKLYYMVKDKKSESDTRRLFPNRFTLIEKFL